MATTIGINGFGRTGRQVFRALVERHASALEVVAINDLTDVSTNTLLLTYDSNYGRFAGEVEAHAHGMLVNGTLVQVRAEPDPLKIPWNELGVSIVIEATGRLTDDALAARHLRGGVRRVVVTAPITGGGATIIMGVNEHDYNPTRHRVISNASCTTNGLAPVVKVLQDHWGIEKGMVTAVHAYTNSQKLLDMAAKDPREARAAPLNIVPAPTGATKALGLVIPELQGLIGGMAFRVPTATVSALDFTAVLRSDVSPYEVNAAFQRAANGPLKGILAYTDEPLVSMDFKGDSHSAIISGHDTQVTCGNLIKVVAWYDNEYGYACRVSDLVAYIAHRDLEHAN